jgi:hypothetical protein
MYGGDGYNKNLPFNQGHNGGQSTFRSTMGSKAQDFFSPPAGAGVYKKKRSRSPDHLNYDTNNYRGLAETEKPNYGYTESNHANSQSQMKQASARGRSKSKKVKDFMEEIQELQMDSYDYGDPSVSHKNYQHNQKARPKIKSNIVMD